MTSPFSIQSIIVYALLKLICYAFVQPCSFGRQPSTRLAAPVINHFCTRYALFLCSCAALYRTSIPQSFWNTRCGRPQTRKFHLTRSLVAFGRRSGTVQTENTVRHSKHGRRPAGGMVVGEGGHYTGVLLHDNSFSF